MGPVAFGPWPLVSGVQESKVRHAAASREVVLAVVRVAPIGRFESNTGTTSGAGCRGPGGANLSKRARSVLGRETRSWFHPTSPARGCARLVVGLKRGPVVRPYRPCGMERFGAGSRVVFACLAPRFQPMARTLWRGRLATRPGRSRYGLWLWAARAAGTECSTAGFGGGGTNPGAWYTGFSALGRLAQMVRALR